jgi:hypothetical protein
MPSIGAASPALHVATPDFPSLSSDQLAELGGNPEMLEGVRAEVYRRLRDDPRKANFLTFRWLLPADEVDKTQAFDGLMACCWNATEKRILPYGLFPYGYLESEKRERLVEKMRDSITTGLIARLYEIRSLAASEIITAALNGDFQIDAEVANAVRQEVRQERKTRSFEVELELASLHEEEGTATFLDILEDRADSQNNPSSDASEVITLEIAQITQAMGQKGWEVLFELAELIDGDSLPEGKRDRERVVTEVFQDVYGVKARQARTRKDRFQEEIRAAVKAGNPVLEKIVETLASKKRRT